MDNRPIGVFDSGVGGLSIWRAIRKLLPQESMAFFADSGHVPYGEKSTEALEDLTGRIARFLISRDAKLIVVACNTATVHTIAYLREAFPDVPFVGVVPVVKTLASRTRTGTIAVLSTPATSESPYLAALIREFASDKNVINVGCDGLENMVESGQIRTRATSALLERHLAGVKGSAADVVGLGCTHYPFLRARIKRMLGTGVRLYDPSRPVARRVRHVLAESDTLAHNPLPEFTFYTTGDTELFARVATKLLRFPVRNVGYVDLASVAPAVVSGATART
jgi:glutamate racemase